MVQEFLAVLQAAPHPVLARGAAKLGQTYLYGALTGPEQEHARHALTLLAGHASPLVRRAIAKTVASATNAPHCIVHALASDSSDVAAIVLARSPVLSTAELVDFAATGDSIAQTAIASRPWVASPVCAALAEAGSLDAALALAVNPGAELLEFSIRRMIERHGQDADLRGALLARPNLPISLRSDLACAAAMSRAAGVTERARLPQEKAEWLIRETRGRDRGRDAGHDAINGPLAAFRATDRRAFASQLALRQPESLRLCASRIDWRAAPAGRGLGGPRKKPRFCRPLSQGGNAGTLAAGVYRLP
jgi:uncharacterized protein (DUF2336 family)